MLDDDCRVGNERPEVVGPESGIPLEVGEESRRIGIVIRVFHTDQTSLPMISTAMIQLRYRTVSPITASSRPLFDADCDAVLGPCFDALDDNLPIW